MNMKANDIFSYAFSAIKLRKLRAGLTTLGVVIGIAAIVALLSLGQGFQDAITAQFEKGFATNTLIVSPRGFQGESSYQLLVNDTATIESIENVTLAVPVIQKTVYAKIGERTFIINVAGVDFSEYGGIFDSTFIAESGNIPSNPKSDAIVVGARIHDPWQNGTTLANVGDSVEIIWTTFSSGFTRKNETYTGHVVAVLKEVGGFSFGGPSDIGVYIPISKAEDFFGSQEVNSIIAQLKDSEDATINDVSEAIRNAFGGQVSVTSSTAVLGTIASVFSFIELFLAGVAGISLLVAGIGIMNIMIVSLMERTREIGILKALGMKGRTVLLIFLSEAIIIGLLGAIIGIALGVGLAEGVARFGFLAMEGQGFRQGGPMNQDTTDLTITPVLTPTVFVGAFSFGLLVSMIFALYPAWRASKLKPVDALRYE
ncbi:MAG TPA: ABC transporter permease [Candidatus Bathyarchaeia archaeon]|nr:ABC transporter permease [Candidatus Bathyarchaeia archaeon]